MRDKKRIGQIMALIHKFWLDHPDMRFHQVLDYLAIKWEHMYSMENGGKLIPIDTYYIEDTEVLRAAVEINKSSCKRAFDSKELNKEHKNDKTRTSKVH